MPKLGLVWNGLLAEENGTIKKDIYYQNTGFRLATAQKNGY